MSRLRLAISLVARKLARMTSENSPLIALLHPCVSNQDHSLIWLPVVWLPGIHSSECILTVKNCRFPVDLYFHVLKTETQQVQAAHAALDERAFINQGAG